MSSFYPLEIELSNLFVRQRPHAGREDILIHHSAPKAKLTYEATLHTPKEDQIIPIAYSTMKYEDTME